MCNFGYLKKFMPSEVRLKIFGDWAGPGGAWPLWPPGSATANIVHLM